MGGGKKMKEEKKRFFCISKAKEEKHILIQIFGIKLKLRIKHNIKLYREKLKAIENELKNKKDKINITFMVSVVSMFPARAFLDYLLKNQREIEKIYNIKILIIPDFRFGIEEAKKLYSDCYKELSEVYGNELIIKSPLENDNINIKEFTDILFCSLPYDISHPKYNISNIIDAGILPVHINYAYTLTKYERKIFKSELYSLFWRIFAENKYTQKEILKYSKLDEISVPVVGYGKMDTYQSAQNKKVRKTIIISPHHSIKGGSNDVLQLSNFLKYSDFFLELPDLYPNIDFIFRPHPALFITLKQNKFWGQEKTENYIKILKGKKNIIYSTEGNYLDTFAISDGMINDCCSFLAEYFYTGKPQCYMLKNPKIITDKFIESGIACLNNCYKAFNKTQIIDFIENVIINNNDYMKEERIKFAQEKIMINYPNTSEEIYKNLEYVFNKKGK